MLRPIGGAGLDAESWATTRRLVGWLERLLGAGRPLDDDVRQHMERFFGRSLEDVRVHDSLQAGEVARRLGGQAFTIGGQIFGDEGDFSTLTPEGMGLMAHELTHVIQQTQPPLIDSGGTDPGRSAVAYSAAVSRHAQSPQFASQTSASPETGAHSLEAEATSSEQAVRQTAQGEEMSPQNLDVEELADRVYRLMQQELRADRERNVRTT